ncbi:hypothetical protein BTH41_00649 [Bacillus mycoides]|nr:hypothetical protein BTH41_00649 [Bacillus mycoides]
MLSLRKCQLKRKWYFLLFFVTLNMIIWRGAFFVSFTFEMLEDKVEFFEAPNLVSLEKKINEQIDNNKALMLEVHHISHQMVMDPESKRPYYSAVVHFKLKKLR